MTRIIFQLRKCLNFSSDRRCNCDRFDCISSTLFIFSYILLMLMTMANGIGDKIKAILNRFFIICSFDVFFLFLLHNDLVDT